jgi:hypothetical protein
MTPFPALDDCFDLKALEEVLRTAAAVPESDRRVLDFNGLMSDLHGADRIAKRAGFADSAAVVSRFASSHPRVAHFAEVANLVTSPRFISAILRCTEL